MSKNPSALNATNIISTWGNPLQLDLVDLAGQKIGEAIINGATVKTMLSGLFEVHINIQMQGNGGRIKESYFLGAEIEQSKAGLINRIDTILTIEGVAGVTYDSEFFPHDSQVNEVDFPAIDAFTCCIIAIKDYCRNHLY